MIPRPGGYEGRKENTVKYLAKYKLSGNQYLAVLENALVIVTTDDSGKPIRWVIFKKNN